MVYVTRVSLDIAINPEQKVTGEDVSGTVGRRWHCGDVSSEDEGGIHPLCTCESSHKPTGGRDVGGRATRKAPSPRKLGTFIRPFVVPSAQRRKEGSHRADPLTRAPSRSSIRVIAFPPLPFNVGKWAPCHACSPLLDPSSRDPLPLPLPLLSFLQESLRDSRTTFIQFRSTGAGRKIATYLRH